MTAMEPYQPKVELSFQPGVDDWVSVLPNVIKLAELVADTEFVPDSLRRKPAAVAAALLTGREMGLAPMLALRHLFVIKGRVGQSAELMRAQVFRAGHEIRYIESTDTRCVVEGRRKEESDWTRVAFTADEARNAQIDLRRYGQDKLVARATSRLCRRKFPDAVMGLPTIDELEDTSDTAAVVELAPAVEGPAVQRKRAPRKAKAASTQPKPAPAAPVADDDDLLSDEPTADPTPLDQAKARAAEAHEIIFANIPEPAEPATAAQNRKMHALFRELELTERADRLVVTSHILGYDLTTSSGLTKNEANTLIDTLERWQHDGNDNAQANIRDILNEATIAQAGQAEVVDD